MSARRRPLFALALAVGLGCGLLSQAPMRAAAPSGSAGMVVPPSPISAGEARLGEALAPSNPSQIALAEHLRNRGVVFYGAYWCQHCFDQKLLFGQQAGDRLPYVECAKDEAGARRCEAAGVMAYPTWVMAGKERLIGVKTLRQLAAWSDYTGPSDFPASRLGR